ncbi:MAG TPA: amidohydrolase family protein [Mucilaginibacter sp.]|nr:amidohydrolase family protein [Mucilaginibacter sp.]
MKKRILTGIVLLFTLGAFAQTTPDSVTFLLHKFEQHIGKETYSLTKNGKEVTYAINFKFVDRGSPVQLNARMKITNADEPLELDIKGKTSRSSTINDTIRISGTLARISVNDSSYTQQLTTLVYPVASYAPGTVQQLLIKYWKNHGRPSTINTLPFGSVQIQQSGKDEFSFKGKILRCNRFTIGGLIWGNEILWTDDEGQLICLITNDAEADKLEMMREEFEPLLSQFIDKAAVYGMELFKKSMPDAGAKDKLIAITGGNLIDVVHATTIPDAVIVIRDGIIQQVGAAGKVTIPAGAKVINAKGKTILPGLWDMHAHFEQVDWGPAYLAAGVTTVRDCGNEFGFINSVQSAIDKGQGIGPKILKAGIIDGNGPMGLGIIKADTKEEAVKDVDRYKANGFIQIKIYSSVKPAIVKAICDEAHRVGLTVTGHIPNGMTLQAGIDSGMDMVNHVQYVYSAMKRNGDRSVNFEDSASVAVIKFLKDHHVVVDPTLGVFELMLRSDKEDITAVEPAYYTLPQPYQVIFKNTGMEPATAAKLKPLWDSFKKIVKVLYDNGVTIIAGTDQGFPGYSLDRELELYVQAGLTPMQAIQTATITPASVMKLDKQTGSAETGKNADLIIVDGDPLNNIRDIRKVTTVIKGGKIYDPMALHKMVGFSK